MEYTLKINLNDITYMSELIPPSCFRKKAGGINSHNNLLTLSVFVSYVLI
jgi:hypothetical protein